MRSLRWKVVFAVVGATLAAAASNDAASAQPTAAARTATVSFGESGHWAGDSARELFPTAPGCPPCDPPPPMCPADGGGVRDCMPHAVIAGPSDVVVGQTVDYDGSSSTPTGGLSFAWNVGGVTGSGQTISVTWTSPGTGTATLTVTDATGMSDTASMGVTVRANTPPPPPADRDGDGVPDDRDDCPNVPGPASNRGCPTDRDGDGEPDITDKCPDVPGPISNSGCPFDRDNDGVPDATDRCPDDAGPASNNGCPPDRDNDGVPDSLDKCPDTPGRIVNAGCPDDRDKDGVPDDIDQCPDVPGPQPTGCPPTAPGQNQAGPQPKPPAGAPPSTPSAAPPAKTEEDKAKWTKLSLELNIASNEFWVLCGVSGGATFIPGIHTLPVGIFTALVCTTAGAYGLASAKYAKWANDPPDSNFTTIPRPATVRLPRIASSRRLSRRAAAALNALVRSTATEANLIRALTQASERGQGAVQAGDTIWAARQQSAAVTYAARLVRVIRAREKLRSRVRAALPASRFPRMSRTGVRQTLKYLRRHGFPQRAKRVLATLGLTASERARLQATVRRLNPREIRVRPFVAILSSRAVTRAERASAEAFEQLAGG